MTNEIKNEMEKLQEDMVEFAQRLIRAKSYTGDEEQAVRCVYDKMVELGYDEVLIDDYGNVLGRVGEGEKEILFDAHLDVVGAEDGEEWRHGPFSGDVADGQLWGRGSADCKGSVISMVYSGALMKRLGLLEGKRVYISASIMEEDYDGELLDRVMSEQHLNPSFAVIGEPSQMKLALGHRGRAMYVIRTSGISAHASAPDTGDNAIYKMARIITRVDELNRKLQRQTGEKGSVAVTRIESYSASLNAIPDQCSIYLDRRLALGEDEEMVGREMDELVEGADASWEIYDAAGPSWKGRQVVLHTFLPAWETDRDSELALKGIKVYEEVLGKKPELFKWDFATNGFACAGRYHVPTIGLGPGDYILAHKKDEHCSIREIAAASAYYAALAAEL